MRQFGFLQNYYMHDIKIEFERNDGELVESTQHDALQPESHGLFAIL